MPATGYSEKIRGVLGRLLSTGFFNIFGSSVINKVIGSLLGIVLVRVISKADYGVYAYANNIIGMVLLVNGLSAASTMLQLGSERHAKEGLRESYMAYAYRTGMAFDVLLGLAVVCMGLFLPLAISGSSELLLLYAAYPMAMLVAELGLTRLRCDLRNKEYALATNIQTVLLAVFSVGGALLFAAPGLVVGQSLAYLVSAVFIARRYGLFPPRDGGSQLTPAERRDYWGISLISVCNNGLSQALQRLGNFLVGVYLGSAQLVAEYNVATTIPYALLFIPTCVVVYVYPYFARHAQDRAWCLRHFRLLLLGNCVGLGLVVACFWAAAEPLVTLVFGSDYASAVPTFRILLLGFLANSVARQPCGNLLVTQRRLKFNFVMGVASLIVILVASVVLIPAFGMEGAAWAYTITMAFGGVCNAAYYYAVAGKGLPGTHDEQA